MRLETSVLTWKHRYQFGNIDIKLETLHLIRWFLSSKVFFQVYSSKSNSMFLCLYWCFEVIFLSSKRCLQVNNHVSKLFLVSKLTVVVPSKKYFQVNFNQFAWVDWVDTYVGQVKVGNFQFSKRKNFVVLVRSSLIIDQLKKILNFDLWQKFFFSILDQELTFGDHSMMAIHRIYLRLHFESLIL